MTVKHSLLAILAQSSCYGYQLRAEFQRRTANLWPLNVGQIYNTLERLERDGLVVRGLPDAQGHVIWTATTAGVAVAEQWLNSATPRADAKDELAMKISLAATLPSASVGDVLEVELTAAQARAQQLSDALAADTDPGARLVRSSALYRANADVSWLRDTMTAMQLGEIAEPHPVTTERPRRGRPRSSVA